MRVGIVLEQCLAPVPGGTGRYAREIARALAARAPAGSTVASFVALHQDIDAARVEGVGGPHRLPAPRRVLAAAWAAGLPPRVGRVDVLYAPTLLFPPRANAGLVVTVHDTVPWTHPETLTARGVRWHRRMAALAARHADAVVVPTDAVAGELVGVVRLAQDRVHVVGEGVSAELTVPADADERARRLQLPERYLVTLATVEPRKGLDVALAALAQPDVPPLPLVVAGQPGWGNVDPVAIAARAGLAPDRLRLVGRLGDPDLAVVLSRATALVAPSRAEGFGLPLIEAMSLGTPVVASDIPAFVEVAAGAAVHVPVGDAPALATALVQVCGDADLRARLVRSGRDRAGVYTWHRAADALWQLFSSLFR